MKRKRNYIVALRWTGLGAGRRLPVTVHVTADSYREALAAACRQCEIEALPYEWSPLCGGGVYGMVRRRRHECGVTRWEVVPV